MQHRREALQQFAREEKPVAIRRLYYRSTTDGPVEKTNQGYRKIQNTVTAMRRDGSLPWSWISDGTRLMRKPRSHDSIDDALDWTVATSRKNLWAAAEVQVEIWCEKDAITGTVFPVTSEYDVPLMIARGFSSLSFLYSAAMQMQEDGRPAYIYHLATGTHPDKPPPIILNTNSRSSLPALRSISSGWRSQGRVRSNTTAYHHDQRRKPTAAQKAGAEVNPLNWMRWTPTSFGESFGATLSNTSRLINSRF